MCDIYVNIHPSLDVSSNTGHVANNFIYNFLEHKNSPSGGFGPCYASSLEHLS